MVVENVHIIKPEPRKARVKTGKQILSASPVPVRTIPHRVTGLRADNQFVAVSAEIFAQNAPEIALRRTRFRPVVVGKVKVRDAAVKSREAKRFHVFKRGGVAEVVPKTE